MVYNIVFTILAFLGNFQTRLLIPTLLFMRYCPRRKLFPLSLLLLIPYLLIPQLVDSFFLYPAFQIGFINLSFTLWYALLFLILRLGFEISIGQLLYISIASYTIQNIVQNAMNPISMIIFRDRVSAYSVQSLTSFAQELTNASILRKEYALFYVVFYLCVMAIIYLIFNTTVVTEWTEKRELEIKHWSMITLMIIMLFTLNIISFYLLQFNSSGAMSFDEIMHYSVINLLLAIASVLMLVVQRFIFSQTQMEKDREFIERMLEAEKKQSVFARDSIEIINMKAHDIKGQIAALRSLPKGKRSSQEEAKLYDSLDEAVSLYDSNFMTDNEMLNVILTEKSMYCIKNDIRFSCIVDGSAVVAMDDADIYSLFGNALNNSIESAEQAENPEDRNVSMRVWQRAGFLCVEIENYCGKTLSFKDGLPQTTKPGMGISHGYGTQSMRYVVEKYGGNLVMSQEGSHFITTFIIPISQQ